MPSAEILAVLADEVADAQSVFGASLAGLCASDASEFGDAKAFYVEQLQRIGEASGALGLTALQRACSFIAGNVGAFSAGDLTDERRSLLEFWPDAVLSYLSAPRDKTTALAFVALLCDPSWPNPLDDADAAVLSDELQNFVETEHDAGDARQTVARPEDVALDVPKDINPRLLDAFLAEGPQQANEYSALIQQVVSGEGWADELSECRRLIHALKGAANTVGVRGIASLCHHTEDILEFLVENSSVPDEALGKLLVKVADMLEGMFEALLGISEAPTDRELVLQSVLDAINRIEKGEPTTSAPTASADERIATVVVPTKPSANETTKSGDRAEPRVRIPARAIDGMLWTSGEIAISNSHSQERLKQALAALAELSERQKALRDRSNDMENFATVQGIAAGRRHVAHVDSTDGAPSKFDPLEMDQYNELHMYALAIAETVSDMQLLGARLFESLTTVSTGVAQQGLLNNELHDQLMKARMVSARHFDSRLQRTVRQAAEQCGKRVALHVQGADVMIDDQLANQLIDPLLHLLRNAVDHGVEATDTRTAFGKPETGNITVSFARDGNYLNIVCGDDGAGLDLSRIRSHALARGLIRQDQHFTDEQTMALIFQPGFSTADHVTEVSGRGVGMDIVNSAVTKLKGSIDIATQAGQGTTFTLRVPMSLGILHCLLVKVDGQTFALPSDNLERIVYNGGRNVRFDDDGMRYREDDENCPAYLLAQLTGTGAVLDVGHDSRPVILIKTLSGKAAVIVDAVTGGSDLVIKAMGKYLTSVKGVTGASILGDGTVVPILDFVGLVKAGQTTARTLSAVMSAMPSSADVLVVDDSLSVRTALSILLTDAGFRVRMAKDGIEAMEAIDEQLPTVVLADLEMPRMNGLDLTTQLRMSPRTRNLPVIMVTSRTSEKHRTQAKAAGVDDYFTKPYRESDLVERVRTFIGQQAA